MKSAQFAVDLIQELVLNDMQYGRKKDNYRASTVVASNREKKKVVEVNKDFHSTLKPNDSNR